MIGQFCWQFGFLYKSVVVVVAKRHIHLRAVATYALRNGVLDVIAGACSYEVCNINLVACI